MMNIQRVIYEFVNKTHNTHMESKNDEYDIINVNGSYKLEISYKRSFIMDMTTHKIIMLIVPHSSNNNSFITYCKSTEKHKLRISHVQNSSINVVYDKPKWLAIDKCNVDDVIDVNDFNDESFIFQQSMLWKVPEYKMMKQIYDNYFDIQSLLNLYNYTVILDLSVDFDQMYINMGLFE